MNRWSIVLIAVLAVLVPIVGVGGYMMGTTAGERRANEIRRDFYAQRGLGTNVAALPGGAGAQVPGLAAGAGRAGTTGTVKSIEGDTITVTTRNGETKVKIASDTAVQKMQQGTLQDVKPGMRIVVTGEAGANGVVTARSIQIVAAGD